MQIIDNYQSVVLSHLFIIIIFTKAKMIQSLVCWKGKIQVSQVKVTKIF